MFTKETVENYFNALKNEGLLYITIGLCCIILGVIFFIYCKNQWHKGFAVILFCSGIWYNSVGIILYNHCDEQRKSLVYAYDMNPLQLKNQENIRLKSQQDFFRYNIYFQIAVLIIAPGIFFYNKIYSNKAFLYGVFFALLVQVLISLGIGYCLQERNLIYKKKLLHYFEKPT